MWTDGHFGHVYIWLGLPHVWERPALLLGTYVRLRCKRATGCNGVLGTGSSQADSCSEGAVRSPNWCLRAPQQHCAGWMASWILAHPRGNFPRGDLTRTTLFWVDTIWQAT